MDCMSMNVAFNKMNYGSSKKGYLAYSEIK